MKTKTFTWLFISVVAVCLALTVAHVIYAIYAYQNCSIIQFIAEEMW